MKDLNTGKRQLPAKVNHADVILYTACSSRVFFFFYLLKHVHAVQAQLAVSINKSLCWKPEAKLETKNHLEYSLPFGGGES